MGEQSLKDKTATGLFWGGLSNGLQQFISLVFGIFLARLLDANAYGMVGMLTIFTLIGNTLQESGFITALANKRVVKQEDYNAVFWFSSLVGLSLYVILFFAAPLIARFYDNQELIPLAHLSFLSLPISALGVAPRALLFHDLKVKESAYVSVISLLVSGLVGVKLAYDGMSYWGIAYQNITYVGMVTVLSFYFSKWHPNLAINFRPLRGMIGFSSKLVITTLFIYLNNNLFSVLLGRFYTEKEVGYFTQANKWNTMGNSIVTNMVQGVSQPVLSRVNQDLGRQRNVFRKMLRFTSFISFPVMFGLSLVSYEFIIITITEKWLPAASILQLLCISGAFVPVIRLYMNLLISKGKSSIYMWNIIFLCILQLMVMLMVYPYGIKAMVIWYVSINIGWLFIWHYFIWREIRLSFTDAFKDILPFAGIAAISMGITYVLTLKIENIYILFITRVLFASLFYLFSLWIGKATILKESLEFFRQKMGKKRAH